MKNVCPIGLYSWYTKGEFPGILDRLIEPTAFLKKGRPLRIRDTQDQTLWPVTYSNMGLKIKLATFSMRRSYATYDKDIKAIYGIDKIAQVRPELGPVARTSRETFLLRWRARVTGGGPRASAYLVDRRVLPQRQVPEAAADLVSALPDCEEEREAR